MKFRATAIVGDPHEAARLRIVEILRESAVKVIAEVSDAETLVTETIRLRPVLVTTEIRMPKMGGLDAVRRIKEEAPEIAVFVLTNYPDERYHRAAREAGAEMVIPKPEAYAQLNEAIENWLNRRDQRLADERKPGEE